MRRLTAWIVGAAIVLGILFRLIWIEDMNYAEDQVYLFERSQNVGVTESWPWLGMPSSVGLPNPGMSTWFFIVVAKVFSIDTPQGLTFSVRITNCLALLFFLLLARWKIPPERRDAWIYAAALYAVNPLAVHFDRVLWQHTMFPILLLITFWAWMSRGGRFGAFFWGLFGAALGQIHMPGFFFALGWVLWTFYRERRTTRWLPWLAGSTLGALPLIPWILALLARSPTHSTPHSWMDPLRLRFWKNFIEEPFGMWLDYTLGHHFQLFKMGPWIGNQPTYLVYAAHLGFVLILGWLVVWIFRALWRERRNLRSFLWGSANETDFGVQASLWGGGVLMNFLPMRLYRHYMLVVFPWPWIWMTRWMTDHDRVPYGRRLLLLLGMLQAFVSWEFLVFLRSNGGAEGADYGVSLRCQTVTGDKRSVPKPECRGRQIP